MQSCSKVIKTKFEQVNCKIGSVIFSRGLLENEYGLDVTNFIIAHVCVS